MILVAGSEYTNDSFYQTLNSFTSAGQNDDSFGTGGFVTFDPTSASSANSVAFQSVGDDSYILVAGSELSSNDDYDQTLFRFTSNGEPDMTFDRGNGGVSFDPSEKSSSANSVIIDANSQILVAGSQLAFNGYDYQTLNRFNSDGSDDDTFEGGGFAFAPSPSASSADSVALQPDGQILVSGTQYTPSGNYAQTLYRFSNDGTLDPSFSGVSPRVGDSGPLTTTLAASFTDADANDAASTDTATVNWGDGTRSNGAIATGGANTVSITASHIYAMNGTFPITVTIIDSLGAAVTASTSFTGGLYLENGVLESYNGTTSTVVDSGDSGVEAFVVRNADSTVFSLHNDGDLLELSGSTSAQVPGNYRSIELGPDGSVYALLTNGSLGVLLPGSFNPVIVDGAIKAIVNDTTGDLYKLYLSGALSVMAVGSMTWTPVLTDVSSVTPSGAITAATWVSGVATITTPAGLPQGFSVGQSVTISGMTPTGYNGTFTIASVLGATQFTYALTTNPGAATAFGSVAPSAGGVNVLTNVGVDWQFLGAAGTEVTGPHLSFTVSGAVTAGQSVTATLSVLDVFNEPVLGYTGSVTLGDSDAPAVAAGDGPPVQESFTAPDDGTVTFQVTFLTSGPETLTAVPSVSITAATWDSSVATITTAGALRGVSRRARVSPSRE